MALAGTLLASIPGTAFAQATRESDMEARLKALEESVAVLRAELAAARAAQADAQAQAMAAAEAASTQAKAAEVRVAAMEGKPATVAEGFRVGGTTIKIGGFLKTVATFSRWDDGVVAGNSFGRDFYLPSAIPVGGIKESVDNDFSAKQTRLWLSLGTDVAGHTLKGYLETDFQTAPGAQGSERTTNGYNLALRRAYLQFDDLTVGQDWTTFQYTGALPESTDFVGATEGTPFVRQPLVRYSAKLSPEAVLHVSVENPETASATGTSPTLTENDDDRIPDFAARLAYTAKFGELSLAGVVRQLSVDNGTDGADATGWGVSGGGKIFLNAAKSSDLRFLATYGRGIGRYIGLNFAPDAIFVPGDDDLATPSVFAALAAARVGLTDSLRVNLIGSWQDVDYPDGFAAGTFDAYNGRAWSVAGNLFWSPVKQIDLGVEYRHGERSLVSGADGQLDRLEFAARYNF
jgi:hypothetical protein